MKDSILVLVIIVGFAVMIAGKLQCVNAEESENVKQLPIGTPVVRVVEVIETDEPEYFDVPLSHDIQDHIFATCEEYGIAPALVVAMIAQESDFGANKVGDGGDSAGLLQVQQKWHQERMDRLGCTDLLDPYQNITVAVDYIAELKEINPDLYWVLMHIMAVFVRLMNAWNPVNTVNMQWKSHNTLHGWKAGEFDGFEFGVPRKSNLGRFDDLE